MKTNAKGSLCVPGSSGPPDFSHTRRRSRPHNFGCFRGRCGRSVQRKSEPAVDVRGPPGHRLCLRAGTRRTAARPVRLQGADRGVRRGDGVRPVGVGVHRVVADSHRRTGRGRSRRCLHVHLGAAASAALVQAAPGAARHAIDRNLRATRPSAVGSAFSCRAVDLGLDGCLCVGRGDRCVVYCADHGVGEGHPERRGRRARNQLRRRDARDASIPTRRRASVARSYSRRAGTRGSLLPATRRGAAVGLFDG